MKYNGISESVAWKQNTIINKSVVLGPIERRREILFLSLAVLSVPPSPGQDLPGQEVPPLPHGIVGNVAMHYGKMGSPPLPCGQTDRCKNITFPQPSGASGKNNKVVLAFHSIDLLPRLWLIYLKNYSCIEIFRRRKKFSFTWDYFETFNKKIIVWETARGAPPTA